MTKVVIFLFGLALVIVSYQYLGYLFPANYGRLGANTLLADSTTTIEVFRAPVLDRVAYDAKLLAISGYSTTTASSTATSTSKLWPVRTVYPKVGAILPFKRVVAYYGNLYSKGMGVLGQYPSAEVLSRLKETVKAWEQADPTTPVVPALDYIAVTAQDNPGSDGKHRLRMPDEQIEKVLKMAESINAIVILEVQPGLANLQNEIKVLRPYLKKPQVHLAIDPEFCMKDSKKPGDYIGTVDAKEVNWAADYLAEIVKTNNLPPKILIVHRFTEKMVTNYKNIKTLPEVQIVLDMDGWGAKERKINTYQNFVANQPIQFTGFKLFYKNDFREKGSRIMTPSEVLKLKPQPVFIQYQ